MSLSTLHYIYDPMCGWCYGAAPLVEAARGMLGEGLIQAHAGGMMMGAQRRPITPELRRYVNEADQRIADLSGQPFGAAYKSGLLNDTGAVLDSEPPITAILAANQVASQGLALLARVQKAHYVEGRRVAERQVLSDLAADIGIDRAGFESAYDGLAGQATRDHVIATRALMDRLGATGFPSLAIERDGAFTRVELAPYLGRPDAWLAFLGLHFPAKQEVQA
ncbi:DsbA family protein [Rugamonas sp. FT107W]|uniref:DsbA family protein n=1 Tax=Duganella vulcania TaxID=2692166 RepID=A0A845HQJ8_9BURK|nr:DsbA family protein [Duganella vulcania]MYN19134.1 DsbA family protein [Duganella vulcania]